MHESKSIHGRGRTPPTPNLSEIDCIRQSAEGMGGKGGDSPKTVSPEPHKMEIAVEKILSLEEEIEETKMELQHLMHEMRKQIQKVTDADARDLLTKRYLEFKPWKVVASELEPVDTILAT